MTQDPVLITIEVDDSQAPKDMVSVSPETAKIYYNSGPKKVRWEVKGLASGDEVVISPKKYLVDQVRTVFGESREFRLTHGATSSQEHEPRQSAVAALQAMAATPHQKIYWIYDVLVRRNGRTIGYCDPIILIDSDP